MLSIKTGIADYKPDQYNSVNFPYEPDDFQKHSFVAIESGDHVLVTAHTGSGKTTVAEYAVGYGIKQGYKVIYTSPIKALSNQIYGDFKRKYPTWDIGIKTGDIDEATDEAQVIIMTTEILRNMLHKRDETSLLDDVKVVIFDEVHWIKDEHRGTVWEESIIMMPCHIQMIMLSATLPDAIEFAQWIVECKKRGVTYTTTTKRVIPLSHYVMVEQKKLLIMDSDGNFNTQNYTKAMREYNFNLSSLNTYLSKIETPALFFTFSRKKCRQYALSITPSLLTGKESCEIVNLFDDLLRKFDSNIQYMDQTVEIRKLLSRGTGYHHAGLLPPLKEIVQELFSKGLIKVLFVTETFAAGVNMPAKSVVLTGLTKIGSKQYGEPLFRMLQPEEYGQISGRAGRRGIDTRGTVILMPFQRGLPSVPEIKEMMCGKISSIKSRFRMDYSFFLRNMLASESIDQILDTANRSLLCVQDQQQHDCESKYNMQLVTQQKAIMSELNSLSLMSDGVTDSVLKQMYQEHQRFLSTKLKKKALKHYNNNIKPWVESHRGEMSKYGKLCKEAENITAQIDHYQRNNEVFNDRYIDRLDMLGGFLVDIGYLTNTNTHNFSVQQCTAENVTVKGMMASYVNECNPIMLTELLTGDYLDNITDISSLLSVLSLFLIVHCEPRDIPMDFPTDMIRDTIRRYVLNMENMEACESQQLWYSDWSYCYEFCDLSYLWSKGLTYADMMSQTESKIYAGEFVKMMLKLNNICTECEKLAAISNNDVLLSLLDGHQSIIVRDIVTPQSLYVH